MADSKITALTALTSADPANDMIPIVDVSDTPPASGNTKRISINNLLACSPSATLASATITGDLTVDTSTLKVDSANNRVGIGTASPTAGMVLDIVSATSNNFVRFSDGVNATGYLGIRAASGAVYLHGNNNVVSLSCSTSNTTATEQLRITNPGVFEFLDGAGGTRMLLNATGLGVGVVPSAGKGALQLSSGINFPATQVASSDANTLDDYEEGTFTPSIGGTATYTTQTGRYVKIGNRVWVTIRLVINTAGTGDDYRISGLPFVVASTIAPISVGYFAGLKISVGYISGYANTGTSTITTTATTAASANITNGAGVITNNTDLAISCFYEV